VPEGDDSALMAWASAAVAEQWQDTYVARADLLRGDLSTRRFWRLAISSESATPPEPPATAILVDLGPDDLPLYARALGLLQEPLPEPPWINLHRYLSSIGVAVPKLFASSTKHRALLVEDVGELSLRDAVARAPHSAADLFRLAIDELLKIHVEGTHRIHHRCFASSVNYDRRLFVWELSQFVEITLAEIAPGSDRAAIYAELDDLAEGLGRFPRVLSHRDYHAQNLYIQRGPALRVIDFQDALMAPSAQDLAVLLTTRDTGEIVHHALEQRLLDYYYAGLARRRAVSLSPDDFARSYRLAVLQHALKMAGRFMMFERDGKRGYAQYVPHALGQARRILAHARTVFPNLSAALGASVGETHLPQ
jgi:N-acetylmuramate 1-kinase